MGCHFLLQCMKVKNESEVTQSCLTLSNPMDSSPPGCPVPGIFQARVLEWGAIAPYKEACLKSHQFSSVQALSRVQLLVTPWTAAGQTSLFINNSQSLFKLKLMCIKSVMPSNHLILCHPLLLLPSLFPRIRVFSNESVFRIRWPKH